MMTTFHMQADRPARGLRVMTLEATADLLIQMCKNRPDGWWWRLKENPLPDDARLIDVRYDHDKRTMVMVLESEAWPEIDEGSLMSPAPTPIFESRYNQ